MNRDDHFEKRLQHQPLREIPSAWRQEILSIAGRAAVSHHAPRATRHWPRWRELFWPCPQAWAGLAALWLMILGASFAARESSPLNLSHQMSVPSPGLRGLLKQQEQLLAELVGPMEKREADRPKPLAPQPRSQYREEFQNA
jgi:hypothetical protein